MRLGTIVFARHGSTRLPGKALRQVGGVPLLERVIRRALSLPWPVVLATTTAPSDGALVALADRLGVASFRGSEDRVLERAVLAAEGFGFDAFARVCGDRPLFALDDLLRAAALMQDGAPDMVSNRLGGAPPPAGLTTEVVLTRALRRVLDRGVTGPDQEHLTNHLYAHREEFRLVGIPAPTGPFTCPGFAVDTEADLARLDSIFAVSPAIDLSPADAERIHRS